MSEEINTFRSRIEEALDLLTEEKPPQLPSAINDIRRRIENPDTTSIKMSFLVSKLVDAGYNIKDILWFFERAGIVNDTKDLPRRKMDIQRAIIKHLIEKERGYEI